MHVPLGVIHLQIIAAEKPLNQLFAQIDFRFLVWIIISNQRLTNQFVFSDHESVFHVFSFIPKYFVRAIVHVTGLFLQTMLEPIALMWLFNWSRPVGN